jgi:hypothetical protein
MLLLCTVYCTVLCVLCTVQCILYYVYCTVYTVYCTDHLQPAALSIHWAKLELARAGVILRRHPWYGTLVIAL